MLLESYGLMSQKPIIDHLHAAMQTHQDLTTRKRIIPRLTIAIQSPLSENLNVLTTPDPESDRLLKVVIEIVRLPIFDIVGELIDPGQPPRNSVIQGLKD